MTPINVPAPVVPYVPPTAAALPSSVKISNSAPVATRTKPLQPQPTKISERRLTSSADFNSFAETEDDSGARSDDYDYAYDHGFVETDRIDVQSPSMTIDPNALVYRQNSRNYGEQYPSYVAKTIQTMVGTMGNKDSSKSFGTGDNVVYGMFPEGEGASDDIAEYYDDNFEYYEDDYEYYEEDALKELKEELGIAESASEPKMSFLQLLQNLQNH